MNALICKEQNGHLPLKTLFSSPDNRVPVYSGWGWGTQQSYKQTGGVGGVGGGATVASSQAEDNANIMQGGEEDAPGLTF